MNNHSIESRYVICYSASFSSVINYNEEKQVIFKEEKFKVVQIGINYNEENKLLKVQNRYQLQ